MPFHTNSVDLFPYLIHSYYCKKSPFTINTCQASSCFGSFHFISPYLSNTHYLYPLYRAPHLNSGDIKMEHDSVNGMEGVEGKGGMGSKSIGGCELLLRLLALVLTLVATIVLGVNKQTTVVSLKLADTLPAVDVPVTAKWHYLSAFVYMLVANAIACAYAALSLLLTLANRGKSQVLGASIIILDGLMVALLFSGNGAATAVGVIGYQGNSHVQWNKVCNVFGKFCNQGAASIVTSLVGSAVFLLLVLVPVLRIYRQLN